MFRYLNGCKPHNPDIYRSMERKVCGKRGKAVASSFPAFPAALTVLFSRLLNLKRKQSLRKHRWVEVEMPATSTL